MQKILSLVAFTLALIWTWNIVHSSPAIGFETHSGIQEKLITLITETVRSKKPHAQELQVTRLWTETIDDHKVRAVFTYRLVEPAEGNQDVTEQVVEGEALLHREPNEDQNVDKWIIQEVRTTGDSINFTEGIIVTPTADASEGENEAPASTVPVKTPEKTPEK